MKKKIAIFISLSSLFFAHDNHRIFNLGDFKLESVKTLPGAKLSYVTFGKFNENGVILY